MIPTKFLCLCAVIAALAVPIHTSPATAFTLPEVDKETEKLLSRLADKKFDGLADELEKHELFGAANPGLWQQVVTTVSKAYAVIGEDEPIYGFKKLGQKNIGDTLVSNRYAILNSKLPLLFEFWLYKPERDWQLLNVSFVFGTNSQPVLLRWFEGAN